MTYKHVRINNRDTSVSSVYRDATSNEMYKLVSLRNDLPYGRYSPRHRQRELEALTCRSVVTISNCRHRYRSTTLITKTERRTILISFYFEVIRWRGREVGLCQTKLTRIQQLTGNRRKAGTKSKNGSNDRSQRITKNNTERICTRGSRGDRRS